MSKAGDVLSKLEQLKRITVGGLGAEPLAAGGYGGEAAWQQDNVTGRALTNFGGHKNFIASN